MPLPPDIVCKGVMFLGHPSDVFIHLSRQLLLPWYIMNSLSNLDETYREYLLATNDDLRPDLQNILR